MTQNTIDTSPRNTKIRGRSWGPNTWNNYEPLDLQNLVNYATINCIDFAIQEEVGESGTPHIQFALKFKNARTFSSLKKQFPAVHWEIAKRWEAVRQYCSKEDTAVGQRHVKKTTRIRDPLDGKELYPWQQNIMDLLEEEPDDRTVHWIYDTEGNMGKTSLAKHICLRFPGEAIYTGGKAADIKYGVTQMVDKAHAKNKKLKVVLLDYTRSIENFISYEGIENVKNGIFYNSKYESGMVLFDPPHVVCLANYPPCEDKLSLDRWNIININPPAS